MRRWIVLFPYLGLTEEITLGPWRLLRLDQFAGAWPSEAFERTTRRLLTKYRDADGRAVERMTIALHDGAPLITVQPTEEEMRRLELSVQLAVLSKNPAWGPDADGWWTATSDNCVIHLWPIEERQKYFATERGAVVRLLNGGLRLDRERDIIRAPLELHLPTSFIDREIADSTYRALAGEG